MGRKVALLLILIPSLAFGWGAGGSSSTATVSQSSESDLTFWAPFTDPDNPLTLLKGTGTLSFTRATTATYVHPTTGLITEAASGQLRIESNGALIEGVRTNILLHSRTLNNAAWTATNMTADNTITGEDGVANSASWVAASADNGTICQPVTIASAAYSGAFSLKRITGTGTVMISLDNGATYDSDVSSSLSTSAWYRASKANQTLANPEICLKLGTTGDNVAVDYAQVEAGVFASSRIPTTSAAVARNDDLLTFALSGNVSNTVGTVAATADSFYPDGGGGAEAHVLAGDGSGTFLYRASSTIATWDGTSGVLGGTWNDAASHNFSASWGGSSRSIVQNGGTVVTGGFDGDLNHLATIYIGRTSTGAANYYLFGHIKNIRIWNRALTDAEMVSITQ